MFSSTASRRWVAGLRKLESNFRIGEFSSRVDTDSYYISGFFSFQAKELPTFKDNDFLNEGHKLQIGDDNKKYFLEKLKRDVEVGTVSAFPDTAVENLRNRAPVRMIL